MTHTEIGPREALAYKAVKGPTESFDRPYDVITSILY
jgi:hypothetical protein